MNSYAIFVSRNTQVHENKIFLQMKIKFLSNYIRYYVILTEVFMKVGELTLKLR